MADFHKDLRTKLIERPDVPYHFMRLRPVKNRVIATLNDIEIALSTNALKVFEVGKDFYDPIIYFPRTDIKMDMLTKIEKRTTHCPLKGDTEYFDISLSGTKLNKAAWSYNKPLTIAEELRNLIAFDATIITISEKP